MQISKLLILPWLHKDLAPATLSLQAHCFNPGIAAGANSHTAPQLPMDSAQARAALREMLELGENLSRGGELKALAGQSVAQWQSEILQEQVNERRREERDLQAFAADENQAAGYSAAGTATPGRGTEEQKQQEQLVAAQKVLLLFWNLEERLREIKVVEAELASRNQALKASLSEGGSGDTVVESGDAVAEYRDAVSVAGHSNAVSGDSDAARADEQARLFTQVGEFVAAMPQNHWQNLLGAAAVFLPEDAALVCAETDLPEHLATADWKPAAELFKSTTDNFSEELVQGLAQAKWLKLPLGELVGAGKQNNVTNKAWQKKIVYLFCCFQNI